mgnify:CR=1 FL=1
MSAEPVRAAIVGLGRWGQSLVDAAGSAERRLIFTRAATRSPEKAADFCESRGLILDADLDVLLRHDDLEAVVLATPHSQHAAQIRRIAAAGCHVFVEKPLALTLADARSAVTACESASVTLAVGFNRRFLPAYRALHALIDADRIGQPLHVEGSFCGSFGYGYSDDMWRGSRTENPAGGMAAMGIHVLDAMIAIMGPVRRVSVLSRRMAVSSGLDDTTTVHLEFARGATGMLSTLMATASFWRLHVFGSKGWAQMPDQARLITATLSNGSTDLAFDSADTLAAELGCFAEAIRGNRCYPVTTAQALAGVAAMEAIARSARCNGEWVEVEQVAAPDMTRQEN